MDSLAVGGYICFRMLMDHLTYLFLTRSKNCGSYFSSNHCVYSSHIPAPVTRYYSIYTLYDSICVSYVTRENATNGSTEDCNEASSLSRNFPSSIPDFMTRFLPNVSTSHTEQLRLNLNLFMLRRRGLCRSRRPFGLSGF